MNCSFNIRYKPRTTRAYTNSDLTVYDSAGNTALNALTVYGKSEVVDGAIKSAGEGYAVVRLADLTWTTTEHTSLFQTFIRNMYRITNVNERNKHFLCDYYSRSTSLGINTNMDNQSMLSEYRTLYVYDKAYTTISDFVNSLGDSILCYELDDPTQGNCIAVKTDNGTGIDGTMAVFTTGTPLRGIPDTSVRDVMAWDGSSGEVTKNCRKVNSSDLTWYWNSTDNAWQTNSLQNSIKTPLSNNIVPPPYITPNNYTIIAWSSAWNDKTTSVNASGTLMIKDSDYDSNTQPDFDIIYELATPTNTPLTSTENDSIAGLRTFTPQTHAQNNAQTEMTVDYTIRVPVN